MENRNLRLLLSAFNYELQASKDEYIEMLDRAIKERKYLDIEALKSELSNALYASNYDWVSLAVEENFVYTSSVYSPVNYSFTKENLFEYLQSNIWEWIKPNGMPSESDKDLLSREFSKLDSISYSNIHDLLNREEFDSVQFEVKHQFKMKFGEISYTNEDVIYYLKTMVWEYLYPNALDQDRLSSIKEESLPLLQEGQINEGWTDMSNVLDSIKDCFVGIDLYELSRVDWGKNIQHKNHYRNRFTLGFMRIDPKSL